MRSNSSNASFKTCVSLLIFCFVDLSIGVSGVLKSPAIIVLLSISPFMSVSVCLYILFVLKYYKPIVKQCYTANCVSWAPRLASLNL